MRLLTVILIFCAMGMLACSTTMRTQVTEVRYSRDYIHPAEIHDGQVVNTYQLVRDLRPGWLRSFGIRTMASPAVYLDGFRYGNIYALSTLTTNHITKIQFFNSLDAFIRFGNFHPGGVISVTL